MPFRPLLYAAIAMLSLYASGCSSLKTRNYLSEAESLIAESSLHGGETYAAANLDKARSNISHSRLMLQRGNREKALEFARLAHMEAVKGHDTSLRSHAAISLKSAREAVSLIERNRTGEQSPDVTAEITRLARECERMFLGAQYKHSIALSSEAGALASSLIEPLNRESAILRDKTLSALQASVDDDLKKRLSPRMDEAAASDKTGDFRDAIDIYTAIMKEIPEGE